MERRLAAILAADVVGYSRLMAQDEESTLTSLQTLRGLTIEPLVIKHKGRVVKTMGDGLLVEFQSAVSAVECALAWQEESEAAQIETPSASRLHFRIGVNLGEVVVERNDIYGDGVNVAARLEAQTPPGGVCISGEVHQQVRGKVSATFADLGDKELKNIPYPVRVFQAANSEATSSPAAQSAYHVKALGRFQLTGPNGEIELTSKKLRGLLTYLALCSPERQARDTLMALLWGSYFDKQARQNLRQSIARLKRMLGPNVLVVDEEFVGLAPGQLASDVGRLRSAIREKSLHLLREAMDASSSELLSGVSISEENWSEWLESERLRSRQNLIDALVTLSDLERESANYESALRAAERATDFDPLREDAFRSLVRALDALGRNSDAISKFIVFRKRLGKELGVPPAFETEALINAIRTNLSSAHSPISETVAGQLPEIPEEPSLAVIPFRNITSDERGEIIASGLAEDIVTTFAKISSILVVANASTRKYQYEDVDWETVSREQGVRNVLEGAVRMVGDRVRVTAHLYDATTGRKVWADRFDRRFNSFLDIQDAITKEVVSALQVKLTDGEQARVWARGTDDTKAWENIVEATELIHAHHRDGIQKARLLAQEATSLDPEFAAAWAASGWTHWVEARWGWEDRETSFDRAIQNAERALSLAPDNPDALTLSGVCALHLGRHDEAVAQMESATTNAPGHAHILALTGYVHRYSGDLPRVVACMARAMRISPVHPAWYKVVLGNALWRLGQRDEGLSELREAVRRDPELMPGLCSLAALLSETGELKEANSFVDRIQSAEPLFSARRWCDLNPFRDDSEREKEFDALVNAGASA